MSFSISVIIFLSWCHHHDVIFYSGYTIMTASNALVTPFKTMRKNQVREATTCPWQNTLRALIQHLLMLPWPAEESQPAIWNAVGVSHRTSQSLHTIERIDSTCIQNSFTGAVLCVPAASENFSATGEQLICLCGTAIKALPFSTEKYSCRCGCCYVCASVCVGQLKH